jgi:hypothetical protein
MKSAAAVPIALGSTTSPPTAKAPTSSAPPEPQGGVVCPATTATSAIKCQTLVPTGDDANTPMATTSCASAQLGASPSKTDRLNMTTSMQGATTSAREK